MNHRKLNEAESRLYWQVYVAWSTQAAWPGCITDAPVAAARAVLRARLATEQTAALLRVFEPTIDDVREMALDVFVRSEDKP